MSSKTIRFILILFAVLLLSVIQTAAVFAGDPPPPPPPPPGVTVDNVDNSATLEYAGQRGPKKLPKSMRAPNAPTGSAGANSAFTTNSLGYYKTIFVSGETIRYYGGVYNSTGSYQWVYVWFYRTTLCGTTNLYEGWLYAPPGTPYWYYQTTTYCPGDQTFTFWVKWSGAYSSRAINYKVGVTLLGQPESNWGSKIVGNCHYDNSCAGVYPNTHHVGADSGGTSNDAVLAAGPGRIYKFFANGSGDKRYGNTVIIMHKLANGTPIYTQYSHLKSFRPGMYTGMPVTKGYQIGIKGCSGNGDPTWWCTHPVNQSPHLHFEFKMGGDYVGNPWSCYGKGIDTLFGYAPGYPDSCGYRNPESYVNKVYVLSNW